MDLLLETENLFKPFNLVEALNYTFTVHHRAVCAWENRNWADTGANPLDRIDIRPGNLEIVNE